MPFLSSVGEYVLIQENAALETLEGISSDENVSLDIAGYLDVTRNAALTHLGLVRLESVGADFNIAFNPMLGVR